MTVAALDVLSLIKQTIYIIAANSSREGKGNIRRVTRRTWALKSFCHLRHAAIMSYRVVGSSESIHLQLRPIARLGVI